MPTDKKSVGILHSMFVIHQSSDVLSQKKFTQFHDAVNDAKTAIKNDVKNMIEIFTTVK